MITLLKEDILYQALEDIYKITTTDSRGKYYSHPYGLFEILITRGWMQGVVYGKGSDGNLIYESVTVTEDGIRELLKHYARRSPVARPPTE